MKVKELIFRVRYFNRLRKLRKYIKLRDFYVRLMISNFCGRLGLSQNELRKKRDYYGEKETEYIMKCLNTKGFKQILDISDSEENELEESYKEEQP
jgi:hypothetical protein